MPLKDRIFSDAFPDCHGRQHLFRPGSHQRIFIRQAFSLAGQGILDTGRVPARENLETTILSCGQGKVQ